MNMKPSEILKKYDLNYEDIHGYGSAHSTILNSLRYYKDEECVIAYLTEKIGFCFIIKSKKTYFGFYGVKKGIYFSGVNYVFRRCDLKEAIRLINRGGTILNQVEYNKIKDLELLKSLE